jgi:hypothetical protein
MLVSYHQRDPKDAAPSFDAFDPDRAAMFFDDAIASGQTQSSAVIFGREERREDMR